MLWCLNENVGDFKLIEMIQWLCPVWFPWKCWVTIRLHLWSICNEFWTILFDVAQPVGHKSNQIHAESLHRYKGKKNPMQMKLISNKIKVEVSTSCRSFIDMRPFFYYYEMIKLGELELTMCTLKVDFSSSFFITFFLSSFKRQKKSEVFSVKRPLAP